MQKSLNHFVSIQKFFKNNHYIFVLALFSILFFYFFSYSITVTSDSGHYMSYVEILKGNLPWNSWDIVRGPVFPILILLSNIIFGKTAMGLLMFNFSWYLFMLLFLTFSLKESIGFDRKWKRAIVLSILLMTIINPIVFGYYHTFLTEPIAISLSITMCYLSFKFLKVDFNKKGYLFWIFTVLFSGLLIFSWFLKQPYVSTVLFPFFISIIISITNKFEIKNILYRMFSFGFCIFSLIVSAYIWDNFLNSKGIDLTTDRNVTRGLGSMLISGVDRFEIQKNGEVYTYEYIGKEKFLSEREKKLLLDNDLKNYYIVNIYNKKEEQIESDIIRVQNGQISTVDSIKFLSNAFFKYPDIVINSYVTNYMAIINMYSTYSPDGVGYHAIRKLDLSFINENQTIAYRIFNNSENVFYMSPERQQLVSSFYQINQPPILLNKIMHVLCIVYDYLFKINFVLLPLTFILSIILKVFGKIKEQKEMLLDYIIILLGFSFGHLLLHVFTSALVDRYASPAIITSTVGNILLFYLIYKMVIKSKKKNG